MTWDECRQDIADVLRTAADHQSHVQTFGKSAGSWAMFQEYSDTVSHSTDALELINAVCAAPLQERHWAKLGSLCDLSGNLSNHLSNQSSPARLWSAIVDRADGGTKTAEVEDLLALAIREGKLRSTFDAIKSQWTTATIQLGPYKSKGDIFLESSTAADVMDGLEDAIMTLGSMASNRASHHFRDEIKEFLKLLSNIEESMQLWLSTQSVWSYMEAVFDGGDIAAQLPDEAARFSGIDARYLDIVREAKQVPLFAEFFRGDDKREAFVVLLDELETCQKSLSAYLESKRKMFPRFYFVSDSTLLEILSNGSNPRAVQRQFQAGLFDGVDRLTFESESSVVATHIISKEGESVQLRTSVVATGPAEMWLSDLVQSMRETMRYEARRAAKEVHRMPVEEFLFGRPAQMALLGLQLKWTAGTLLSAVLHCCLVCLPGRCRRGLDALPTPYHALPTPALVILTLGASRSVACRRPVGPLSVVPRQEGRAEKGPSRVRGDALQPGRAHPLQRPVARPADVARDVHHDFHPPEGRDRGAHRQAGRGPQVVRLAQALPVPLAGG